MSDSLLWVALAGGELLLILFVALLISWIRHRAMRIRDKKAIKQLVDFCRGSKNERSEEIRAFLAEKYAMDGDALGYAARSLYKAEAGLIQYFARTYLNRDSKSALNFFKPVQEGVGEYWSLETGVSREGAASTEGDADALADDMAVAGESAMAEGNDVELERLRKENQSLSDELRLTMDTMGRMLNEYSNVFSKDADLGNIQVIGADDEVSAGDEISAGDDEDATNVDEPAVEDTSPVSDEPDDDAASLDVEAEDVAGVEAEVDQFIGEDIESVDESSAEVASTQVGEGEWQDSPAEEGEAAIDADIEALLAATSAEPSAGDVLDDISADTSDISSDEDVDDLIAQADKKE